MNLARFSGTYAMRMYARGHKLLVCFQAFPFMHHFPCTHSWPVTLELHVRIRAPRRTRASFMLILSLADTTSNYRWRVIIVDFDNTVARRLSMGFVPAFTVNGHGIFTFE